MKNNDLEICHIVYEQIKPKLEDKRCIARGYFKPTKIAITWEIIRTEWDLSYQLELKLKTTATPITATAINTNTAVFGPSYATAAKLITEEHRLELNEQCCKYITNPNTVDRKESTCEWHDPDLIQKLNKIIETIPPLIQTPHNIQAS